MLIMDCSSAYYHAPKLEEVYVRPPPEWVQKRQAAGFMTREMWGLRKQLPGRRTAGNRWIDYAAGISVEDLEMSRCH